MDSSLQHAIPAPVLRIVIGECIVVLCERRFHRARAEYLSDPECCPNCGEDGSFCLLQCDQCGWHYHWACAGIVADAAPYSWFVLCAVPPCVGVLMLLIQDLRAVFGGQVVAGCGCCTVEQSVMR